MPAMACTLMLQVVATTAVQMAPGTYGMARSLSHGRREVHAEVLVTFQFCQIVKLGAAAGHLTPCRHQCTLVVWYILTRQNVLMSASKPYPLSRVASS